MSETWRYIVLPYQAASEMDANAQIQVVSH